jgi:hypothetical protein
LPGLQPGTQKPGALPPDSRHQFPGGLRS